MGDRAPDPALVERFRVDVAAALGSVPAPGEQMALAVSGGPDSMAMLVLAAAAFPGLTLAATVDHRLRPEAAKEAAMVAAYCAHIGVPHTTLAVAEPREPGENLHAWARRHRYALLEHWAVGTGARVLATAHHADDQAETFLMRAARGSGVAGLAGVRARQRVAVHPAAGDNESVEIDLLRPLLGWRVADLRALVQNLGVPFVDDPSNLDDRFDRTRFRALLGQADLLDPLMLARSAHHAAEADSALRAMEMWLWDGRAVLPTDPDRQIWVDMRDLPRELKRRLARTAIHRVRDLNGITQPDFPDGGNVESLLDSLEAGKGATQAGILVSPRDGIWRFLPAPPRRSL